MYCSGSCLIFSQCFSFLWGVQVNKSALASSAHAKQNWPTCWLPLQTAIRHMHNKDPCFHLAQKLGEDFSIKKELGKELMCWPAADTHLCSSAMFSDPPHPGRGVPSPSQLTRQKSRPDDCDAGRGSLRFRGVETFIASESVSDSEQPGRPHGWPSLEGHLPEQKALKIAPAPHVCSSCQEILPARMTGETWIIKKWHFEVLVGVF